MRSNEIYDAPQELRAHGIRHRAVVEAYAALLGSSNGLVNREAAMQITGLNLNALSQHIYKCRDKGYLIAQKAGRTMSYQVTEKGKEIGKLCVAEVPLLDQHMILRSRAGKKNTKPKAKKAKAKTSETPKIQPRPFTKDLRISGEEVEKIQLLALRVDLPVEVRDTLAPIALRSLQRI